MSEGSRLCEDRVVVVTGAGRGLGRAHALELARHGARIVVNDAGVDPEGGSPSREPAERVVAEIRAEGGDAVANGADVSDWEAAKALVRQAIDHFGRLDAVVNNAGVVRDQMIVSLEEANLDAVVGVHLKGHFAVTVHASAYWRERAQSEGPADFRLVNTTSPVGLYGGSGGQSVYAAAKAAIAGLTLTAANELSRYGVMTNAIAPAARTRLSEAVRAEAVAPPSDPGAFDAMDPANVSPLVAWLCSVESRGVNGRVFEVEGGRLSLMEGWSRGPSFEGASRLEPEDLHEIVNRLLSREAVPRAASQENGD